MTTARKSFRWLALVYGLVIVLIVWLADDDRYAHVFQWWRAIPGADKLGHFLLMGGFSFTANLAFGLRTIPVRSGNWLLASALVGVIVLLEEVSQIWVSSRTFDLLDLTFDFLGIWFFGRLAVRAATLTNAANSSRVTE